MNTIKMKLNESVLNAVIGTLFKTSKLVTPKSLANTRMLFNTIDEASYIHDERLAGRVRFIRETLKVRLDMSIEDEMATLTMCRQANDNEVTDDIISNLNTYKKINNVEIKIVNKMVSDRMDSAYLTLINQHKNNSISESGK